MSARSRRGAAASLAVAASLCLSSLAGCATSQEEDEQPASSPQDVVTPTESAPATTTSTTSTTPAADPLPPGMKSIDITQTDDKGYKQVATLELYPAIPGKDKQVVQRAWEAVGGKDAFPCDEASGLDMYTGVSIVTQESVYAVGTLRLQNTTADFGSGSMMWDFTAGMPGGGQAFAMGFGFSDGSDCRSLYEGTLLKPTFNGPTWGPVPVIVAYSGIVTPNHPAGDYEYVAAHPINSLSGVWGGDGKGFVVTPSPASWLSQAEASTGGGSS